ncbi:hypothetical protein RB2150_17029 [Rhodobacterales bacterium HTCC2150]|jgi:hypothetical protein|nr:hypothetical protein RB2150_17029 [Rhodobacterales bacterium HTCC2150] [Rhodobacteraceae bacterium HTCC2150]
MISELGHREPSSGFDDEYQLHRTCKELSYCYSTVFQHAIVHKVPIGNEKGPAIVCEAQFFAVR